MEEIIVILSCLANKGCSETSSTYYASHASLRELVQTTEQKTRAYFSPFALEYAGPLILMSTGTDISVKLNRNFSIKNNKQQTTLIYKTDF